MKTLALFVAGLTATTLLQAEYPASEKFSRSYPVSAQAELSLDNINGSVEIVAWNKNEISVEAEKRAPSNEDLSKIHINVDANANSVVIKTEHEKTGWFGKNAQGMVRYTVRVPASLALCKVQAVNSNVTIEDVHGQLKAKTVNGRVRVTGVTTLANLDSVNGNIEASIEAADSEQIVTAKTVNGSCKLSLSPSIAAKIHGSTVNGSIKCALPLSDMESSRHKLSGRIGSGDHAKIDASTVNGNIAFNEL